MILEILKIKFPLTFGSPKNFFTIDEVRLLINILESKSYIYHPTAKTITATIDVSDDIRFNEFYNIPNIKNNAVGFPTNNNELK